MSQPDLARTLRSARPVAPPELRERVRLLAVEASPPRRQHVTWRRALVVAVVVGAAVTAGVIATRPSHHVGVERELGTPTGSAHGSAVTHAAATDSLNKLPVPPYLAPSANRIQRYTASLQLRVPTTAAVSKAAAQAIAISNSLGGYQQYVNLDAGGKTGYAEIRLRIPKAHVQEAVRRLSALGQVIGEHVRIQDLQTGVNATDRLITRLQEQLATLRSQPQTEQVVRQVTALTTRIERLQRGRAATVRTAHYATVELNLATPRVTPTHHNPGPLHGLGTAFRWIGIGAVYALAIGVPFLALAGLIWFGLRTLRRRREDALLSRS
jgi:hypothetical protein